METKRQNALIVYGKFQETGKRQNSLNTESFKKQEKRQNLFYMENVQKLEKMTKQQNTLNMESVQKQEKQQNPTYEYEKCPETGKTTKSVQKQETILMLFLLFLDTFRIQGKKERSCPWKLYPPDKPLPAWATSFECAV